MHNQNQWVPSPTPLQAVGIVSGTRPAQDGIIFISEVRDATGTGAFPTGSATGVYTSDWFQNPSARGVRLYLQIATGAATGTTTVQIQVQNPTNNSGYNLSGAVTAAIAGNTTGTQLMVYPDVPTGAGIANNHLGSRWRVVVTQALAPATFTVGGDYLL
jgi:hypothetical protein